MSADNAYIVFELDNKWYMSHAFMSPLDDDCLYPQELVRLDKLEPFSNRADALVAAHNACTKDSVVEYGVMELGQIPTEPCGRCYVCINGRKIVADDVERCTACQEPLSESDYIVMTGGGTFHKRCEPR